MWPILIPYLVWKCFSSCSALNSQMRLLLPSRMPFPHQVLIWDVPAWCLYPTDWLMSVCLMQHGSFWNAEPYSCNSFHKWPSTVPSEVWDLKLWWWWQLACLCLEQIKFSKLFRPGLLRLLMIWVLVEIPDSLVVCVVRVLARNSGHIQKSMNRVLKTGYIQV